MNAIGKPERVTQERVIALFRDELGYRYLGDWSDRAANSNIDEALLCAHLTEAGYSAPQISRALYLLRTAADHPHRTVYENNQAVYGLLRYGVQLKSDDDDNKRIFASLRALSDHISRVTAAA